MKTLNWFSGGVAVISLTLGLSSPFAAFAAGPAPVDLLSLNNFVIVSKAGVTNSGSHASAIIGNIGASPVSAAAMSSVYCSEIFGTIYGVDAAYAGNGVKTCFAGNPPMDNKSVVDSAVLDLDTAYAAAAGMTDPTASELGAGNIGGSTFAPGLYKWSTDVTIPSSVTLSGSANDVWVFQISGNLNIASAGSVVSGVKIVLSGGAQASNVFWQVGGGTGATLGTYSTFNGNILSANEVIMRTGAVLNGRALAKTQVTLDANEVSVPPPSDLPAPTEAPQPQSQSFDPAAEAASAATINANLGLIAVTPPSESCPSNTLVKGSSDAVYYCGADGKRYVFPNEKVYYSWYSDFSTLATISDAMLGALPLGGNVTMHPGLRMIKVQSDPKVYAVAKGGVLRWVQTEASAKSLYGDAWNTKIDDVSDAFFLNYQMGEAVGLGT